MNKKIFFTDLDGTFLSDSKEITEENRKAVEEALAAGCGVAISSGRPSSSVMIQAKKMGLDRPGCYAVAYNGAEIIRCDTGESLYRKSLPMDYVRYLFEEAEKAGIHCQTYEDDWLYAGKETPELKRYAAQNGSHVRLLEDPVAALTKEPQKVLLASLAGDDSLVRFRQEHAKATAGIMESVFSCREYLEYVSKGVSKGAAVRWLCDYLDCPIENTVAAGDMPNDISMLEACGVGCAMSNAAPAVKAAADYVTQADNNHDGAAEIIRKFVLTQKGSSPPLQ